MKKVVPLLFIFLGFGIATAEAQFTGNNKVKTVSEAQGMDDDTYIILEGFIIEQLEDDDYMFKDDTGEIEVEIDDDVWKGQSVDLDTRIRIQGEIDKDSRSRTVDVEQLSIVKDDQN